MVVVEEGRREGGRVLQQEKEKWRRKWKKKHVFLSVKKRGEMKGNRKMRERRKTVQEKKKSSDSIMKK